MVYKGKEYDALFYSLFWSINPGYKIFGKVVGFHEADVETVVILHDVDNHKPVWVHFGAHGRGQGTWLPYEKCKFTDNGHLIVHVAPESHGLYPMAKTYYRICCLANDRCRTDGEIWFPMKDDFEDARKQTWSNTHYQVRRGINSPLNVSMPGENSITFIERLFLFLPNVMKKIRK